MSQEMESLLQAARKVVREAAVGASKIPVPSRSSLRDKAFGDLVTGGDLAAERHVVTELKRLCPDYGFDSEETASENPEAEYTWVLDPIDGTKYYARDIPLYSTSLALRRGDEPILGVVHCPELNRLYSAGAGQQATLNGEAIRCSTQTSLEQATICLEIPSRYSPPAERRWGMEKMAVLVERCFRVRILGVGALGLCLCAAGGFDAYVNLNSATKPHDTAAGEVIMRGAGGQYLRVGRQEKLIVAGPEKLCAALRELLDL